MKKPKKKPVYPKYTTLLYTMLLAEEMSTSIFDGKEQTSKAKTKPKKPKGKHKN